MKGQNSSIYALAAASLLTFQTIQAGVLDILRGEPTTPEFQRVAFVGGANVIQLNGRVESLVGIDRWEVLKKGVRLQLGDVVRTQEGSLLLQMTESKSFVRVTPNTILRLVPLSDDWDRGALSGREEADGFVVRGCRGQVFARNSGKWEPVAVNAVLAPGTDVRTGPGALVDLFDTDQKQPVRIKGAAQVRLDEELATRRVRTAPTLASARK